MTNLNLPGGSPIEVGLPISKVDIVDTLKNFYKVQATGYFAVTIQGYDGLEDGALFLNEGVPVAAIYEYMKYKKYYYGDDALVRIFNACNAREGILDVYSLTPVQISMILKAKELHFDKARSKEGFKKFIVSTYSEKYAIQAISPSENTPNKFGILKKYGLSKIFKG